MIFPFAEQDERRINRRAGASTVRNPPEVRGSILDMIPSWRTSRELCLQLVHRLFCDPSGAFREAWIPAEWFVSVCIRSGVDAVSAAENS